MLLPWQHNVTTSPLFSDNVLSSHVWEKSIPAYVFQSWSDNCFEFQKEAANLLIQEEVSLFSSKFSSKSLNFPPSAQLTHHVLNVSRFKTITGSLLISDLAYCDTDLPINQ